MLFFLLAAAMVAGYLDTLAGGGGLISTPALLVSGMPPLIVFGTDRLQGCFGTGFASLLLFRRQKIRWTDLRAPMAWAFLGAAAGSVMVQFISTDVLRHCIPLALGVIAAYFLLAPNVHKIRRPVRMGVALYDRMVLPLIGWYDGVLGPGTGSFIVFSRTWLRGRILVEATAEAKPLNFATNLGSFVVFLFYGEINWLVGLLMLSGQMVGAWFGTRSLYRINPAYIRLLVVLMAGGMLVKYSLKYFQ